MMFSGSFRFLKFASLHLSFSLSLSVFSVMVKLGDDKTRIYRRSCRGEEPFELQRIKFTVEYERRIKTHPLPCQLCVQLELARVKC